MSGSIAVYFAFLVANAYWLNIQDKMLGAIQEALTLPLLATQLLIGIISFVQLSKGRFKTGSWAFWTFLIATVNTLTAVFSIFFAHMK